MTPKDSSYTVHFSEEIETNTRLHQKFDIENFRVYILAKKQETPSIF